MLKKIDFLILSLLVLFVFYCPQLFADPNSSYNWELIWVENFDELSLGEENSIWEMNAVGVRGGATYRQENVYIQNGALVIETSKETDANGVITYYTAGIRTRGKRPAKYGYFEVKELLCTRVNDEGYGYVPEGMDHGFWLQSRTHGNDGPYESDDHVARSGCEIDILEIGGFGTGYNQITSSIHWDGYVEGIRQSLTERTIVSNVLFQNEFHYYALEWTPYSYKFYYDNIQTWEVTEPNLISHVNEYILVTSDILADTPSKGVFYTAYKEANISWPKYHKIDWIKLYESAIHFNFAENNNTYTDPSMCNLTATYHGTVNNIYDCVSLVGVKDYVEIENSDTNDALLGLQRADYTFMFWFKPKSIPGIVPDDRALLIGQTSGGPLFWYDSDMKLQLRHHLSDGSSVNVRTWLTCKIDKWHHVAAVVSRYGGYAKIYIDGQLAGTVDFTKGVEAKEVGLQSYLRMGCLDPNSSTYRWDGNMLLDEVRIFFRALDEYEIKQRMQSPNNTL